MNGAGKYADETTDKKLVVKCSVGSAAVGIRRRRQETANRAESTAERSRSRIHNFDRSGKWLPGKINRIH